MLRAEQHVEHGYEVAGSGTRPALSPSTAIGRPLTGCHVPLPARIFTQPGGLVVTPGKGRLSILRRIKSAATLTGFGEGPP